MSIFESPDENGQILILKNYFWEKLPGESKNLFSKIDFDHNWTTLFQKYSWSPSPPPLGLCKICTLAIYGRLIESDYV